MKKAATKSKSPIQDYTKITTPEAAFKACGMDFKKIPDFSVFPKNMQKYMSACFILPIVIEAINEGWKADFTNSDYKYRPWFWVEKDSNHPSGFGFSGSLFDGANTNTCVGSRLCYQSREKMEHGIKYFEEYYKDLLF